MRSLATALVLSFLSLAAAEWVLRIWAPLLLTSAQSAYRFDEELGYSLKPGIHVLELSDHLDEIYANDLGTVNYQEGFEGYEQLVFALGDSFTAGTGLPPDAVYPFQLDLELNLDDAGEYHRRFGVVNLGLPGSGPEQSLLAFERYAEQLGAPRVCAYLGAENDADDDILFLSGYRHKHMVEGSPFWGPLSRPLLWASGFELFKRLKLAVATLRRSRLGLGGDSRPEGAEAPALSVAERSWPAVDRVRSACERRGAAFVLSWANPDFPSYAWLRRKATEQGLPFADWWAAVQSVSSAIPRATIGNPHAGGHYRTWVNRIIARTYAAEIQVLQAQEGR
jgi:hypothetical protein